MIELPDVGRAFVWENSFYLSCKPERIGKLIAHYELFKMTLGLPGAAVECGVFKGASLARLACMREILGNSYAKEIVAFDTFAQFYPAEGQRDTDLRNAVVKAAGYDCITTDQVWEVLQNSGCSKGVLLMKGDILETVPKFLWHRPEFKVSFLNLDVDFYPAAKVVLEHLYPRLVKGGVLLLDDYGVFEGETRAADEYFGVRGVEIRKFPYAYSPSYVVAQ